MKTDLKLKLLISGLILISTLGCNKNSSHYIDQDFPDSTPKLFADEIFSKIKMVRCLSVSPDFKEYYFQPYDNGVSKLILRLRGTEDSYSIDTILNINMSSDYKFCSEPWINNSMDKLFFSIFDSNKELDIFKIERHKNGWTSPIRLDSNINTSGREGHPSVSKNNTLYFHSWTKTFYENNIYYSELTNGKYTKRTKITVLGEDGDAGDPAIAPDESYIVFVSSRKGSFGECDLYISFNNNGEWTTPKNLGSEINSPEIELGPTISPDGRFLFFYRRDKWKKATTSKIYWVDIKKVIEKLK